MIQRSSAHCALEKTEHSAPNIANQTKEREGSASNRWQQCCRGYALARVERTCMSRASVPGQGWENSLTAISMEWQREGEWVQQLSSNSVAGRHPSVAGLRTLLAPGPRFGSQGGRVQDHSG